MQIGVDPFQLVLERFGKSGAGPFTLSALVPIVNVMAVSTSTEHAIPLALPESEPATALRVLLIDDEPEDLDWLGDLLNQTSMEVAWHTASDFNEAMATVKLGGHDAYLVEYRLGAHSGLEMIRESAALATGPMILLTGVGDDDVDAKALAAGAADYLSKDELTPSTLRRSLHYSIETWKARRDAEEGYHKYRALYDNVPAGLLRVLPDGIIDDANITAAEMLGYNNPGDLIGMPVQVLLPDTDQGSYIAAAMLDEADLQLVKADGGTCWVSISVQEVRDETGTLRHYDSAAVEVTRRKEAEEAVLFRGELLNQVPSAVIVTSLDGTCTYWNSHAEIMYGWSAAEAIGQPIYELTVVEEEEEVARDIMAAITAESHWEGEFSVRRRDGSVFPAQVSNSLLLDANGEPVGVVGVSLDLTQTKEAEDALAFQASLLDQIRTSIVVTDLWGRITYWNPQAELAYGYSSGEALGRTLLELVVPDAEATLYREVRESLARSGFWQGELTITRKDGGRFPALASGAVVTDRTGRSQGVVGVIVDLSEVKRAESETRTQEALNRSLLESVGVPIAILDTDAYVVASNPSWEEHVGAAGTQGKGLASCMPGDAPLKSVTVGRDGISRILAGDSEKVSVEYSVVRRLETRHWQMTAMPAGKEGAIVAHWDVTDELMARSALEDTIRAKDEFIASISHELRSPLSVIVGLSEMLRTEGLPTVEIAEFYDLIADQAQEMALIVEDLLVAGRMESETLTIRPTLFDVAVETHNVLKPWHNSPGVDLQVNFEPGTFNAHADTLRFRQIVRNIVSNALRYGQPPVTIDAHYGEKHVVVEVTDHGTGVPSEAVDQMFQPYAHFASFKGQPSSIGLGLHVARRLARLMGGDLTYRREDDRTVFALSLPFVSI